MSMPNPRAASRTPPITGQLTSPATSASPCSAARELYGSIEELSNVGGDHHFDRVRSDDVDDDDAGAGGELLVGRDGLILHRAPLQREHDLPGAAARAGHLEVHGALLPD